MQSPLYVLETWNHWKTLPEKCIGTITSFSPPEFPECMTNSATSLADSSHLESGASTEGAVEISELNLMNTYLNVSGGKVNLDHGVIKGGNNELTNVANEVENSPVNTDIVDNQLSSLQKRPHEHA